MCEATTLSLVALAASGAYTAHVQREQGKADADIAENNARLAQADADATNAMATRESEQQAWRARQVMGQQRAAIAANNLDPTLGTPSDILGDTALFSEVDQQTIRMNAARQAWGFQAQAQNFRNQGQLAKWSGNAQAKGTILGALASGASIYASAYRSGGMKVNGQTDLGGSTLGRSNTYSGGRLA